MLPCAVKIASQSARPAAQLPLTLPLRNEPLPSIRNNPFRSSRLRTLRTNRPRKIGRNSFLSKGFRTLAKTTGDVLACVPQFPGLQLTFLPPSPRSFTLLVALFRISPFPATHADLHRVGYPQPARRSLGGGGSFPFWISPLAWVEPKRGAYLPAQSALCDPAEASGLPRSLLTSLLPYVLTSLPLPPVQSLRFREEPA
jgi:hypothetical protein